MAKKTGATEQVDTTTLESAAADAGFTMPPAAPEPKVEDAADGTSEMLTSDQATPTTVDEPKVDGETAQVEDAEYVAVFGGPMVDFESGTAYTGKPTKGPLTNWLQSQIDAGKIEKAKKE